MNIVPLPIPSSSGGAPPWEALRRRLLERADALDRSGDPAGAATLRQMVESWWNEQQAWDEALREALMANHEINNALVGVSGNVQLLMMSPVGQQPGVRERLQVILRETERVERASRNLGETKAQLGLSPARTFGGGVHGGYASKSG